MSQFIFGMAFDIMKKLGWVLNVLRGKRKFFGNFVGRILDVNSFIMLS